MNLRPFIRQVPDFPIKGITFWDIMDLLRDPPAFAWVIDQFAEACREKDIDKVVAPESRGFLFGCPLAKEIGAGFIPIRKPGKLPRATISETCTLEYGQTTMEMHEDAIIPGERILLIDDVLATGGTARACASLIERQGGIVAGMGFLIELGYLPGRRNLSAYESFSLLMLTEQDLPQTGKVVAASLQNTLPCRGAQ